MPAPAVKAYRDKMRLTDRAVHNLKPQASGQFQVSDDVVPGLSVRVSQGGTKSWVLQYREHIPTDAGFEPGARQRMWTLGTYPDLPLSKARDTALQARHLLKTKGVDPATKKREARTARTFGDLAQDYIERHAKKHKKSWAEDQRSMNADVLPRWRSRLVKSITRRDVHELINVVVDRGAPVAANRVLALVSAVFAYGIDTDWLDGNPATRVKKQPEQSRERVLTDDELQALWKALEAQKVVYQVTEKAAAPAVTPMIARGLQMLLLTAQRPGEVFSMRWEDLDEDGGWWTIPGSAAKNGEAHRVPLTKMALDLIDEARREQTDRMLKPDRAKTRDTKSANLGKWVFAGAPDKVNSPEGRNVAARAKKAAAALRAANIVKFDFHRHDLRRTAATGMARAGVTRETISQVLNHVDRGSRSTSTYDRYSYDREKRAAIQKWTRRLVDIISKTAKATVVKFA